MDRFSSRDLLSLAPFPEVKQSGFAFVLLRFYLSCLHFFFLDDCWLRPEVFVFVLMSGFFFEARLKTFYFASGFSSEERCFWVFLFPPSRSSWIVSVVVVLFSNINPLYPPVALLSLFKQHLFSLQHVSC